MTRGITLDLSTFVVLVLGFCTIAAVVAIMLMRDISETLIRLDVKRFEREFGFEVGQVPGSPFSRPHGGWWGIVSVTPRGWMDRAGVRSGDVVFERHGHSFAELRWAIEQAAAGQTACFVVIGREDRPGPGRDVCLIPKLS